MRPVIASRLNKNYHFNETFIKQKTPLIWVYKYLISLKIRPSLTTSKEGLKRLNIRSLKKNVTLVAGGQFISDNDGMGTGFSTLAP